MANYLKLLVTTSSLPGRRKPPSKPSLAFCISVSISQANSSNKSTCMSTSCNSIPVTLHTVHVYKKSLQGRQSLTVTDKTYIKLWTLSSHIRLFCQPHTLRVTSCWSSIIMSKYVLVWSFCY